jgi:hypothetical protein
MISAYDGIRWGTGITRQFQYERTQSRIGGSIWQYPTRFIENSPIFWADKVQTPVLILQNDGDDRGAVVPGRRVLPGAAAAGQGSLPVQLQRPAARLAATAQTRRITPSACSSISTTI